MEYRALVDELLQSLSADRLGDAVATLGVASLPDEIRGYGHVKVNGIFEKARAKWAQLLGAWRSGQGEKKAA